MDTPDSDKLTEKRALEIIFNTIGAEEYVITYNGTSYDLNVLKARASALGVSGAVNENMHIDVYADFVGSSFMHKIRGYNLLWNTVETTDASGKKVTVREPIGSFSDRKLSTIAGPIYRTLPTTKKDGTELKAHDAITDVHMTADVLINMFNGISTYIGRQSVVSSGYHEKGVGDDLYLSEVLIPHVEK
jgi:DNA polymerase III epsilon subunit-like protein